MRILFGLVSKEQLQELRLNTVLETHEKMLCPNCQKRIDRGDVAWSNHDGGDYGEYPYSNIEITCAQCSREIAYISTWGSIDDFDDCLSTLEQEHWSDKNW